jgi:N6-adenosine-specific RNA methylase IME4
VYDVMTLDQIKELPIKNITADNAILFLWITYPQLKNCFEVMEAWGFEYKTIGFQWIKLNSVMSGDGKRVYHVVESSKYSYFFGMGNWTRGNSETCLIGVKGKPKRVDAGISQLIFTERGAHSQKPAIARDLTVKLCGDLPRIELFARETVPGWACWGDDPTL